VITIIDYGLGNIRAFVNVYERLNIKIKIANSAQEIKGATKIIVPGVGAFDYAMTLLNESGMREELDKQVTVNKIPVLGVCVGMQMLAKSSEEGVLPGLGWIDAVVKRFDETGFSQKTHLPHMGWNDVCPQSTECLFEGMIKPRFYFLHSYYFAPLNQEEVLATTEYNGSFASSVRSGNIFGTQFHPEKSHQWGIQLLKNFANI
jgi:imidazole glycerol-phosphate synthase subunit HisH